MFGPIDTPSSRPPTGVEGLSSWILSQAKALCHTTPQAQPLALWDFDGTLLEGDCTEGLRRVDGSGYPGLAEMAIRHGFSSIYRGAEGVTAFEQDYAKRLREHGSKSAYIFVTQIFAGAMEADLRALAQQHFAEVLAPWFYSDMLAVWRDLEAGGMHNHVISASADFFVKGAAPLLGVPETHVHGLRLAVSPQGKLLSTPEEPVTHGPGKAECLQHLLAALTHKSPHRFYQPLFAVGNDLQADGALLHAVASLPVSSARPLAVLLNPKPGAVVDAYLHPLTCAARPLATYVGSSPLP